MCPACGQRTLALDTRVWKQVFLKRRRRCERGHVATTVEVFAGNLDRRTIDATVRGIEAHRQAQNRRAAVADSPHVSASALARQLGVTEARVRQLRRAAA